MIYYYLKDKKAGLTVETINQIGLGYAFDTDDQEPGSGPFRQAEVKPGQGIDGSTGTIITRANSARISITDQVWHEHGLIEDCWVGWFKDQVPTEQSFRKKKQIPSVEVPLVGGEVWLIPIARDWSDNINWNVALPRSAKMINGEWSPGEVVERYRQLWDVGTTVFDCWVESEGTGISIPKNPFPMMANAISVNYCISEVEIGLLGLFEWSGDFVWSVLGAVINHPKFELLAEKKTALT